MGDKIAQIVKLGRPQNAIVSLNAVLIGYLFTNNGSESVSLSMLVTLLLTLVLSMFASLQNDIEDYRIDKYNNRYRAAGSADIITSVAIKRAAWILLCLSVIMSIFLQDVILYFFVSLIVLCVFVYNKPPIRASTRPLLAIIVLTLCTVTLPYMMGYYIQLQLSFNTASVLLLFGLSLLRASIVLLKDYKDYYGDKKYNKNTFLVTYGFNATKTFSIFLAILGSIIFLISVYIVHNTTALLVYFIIGSLLCYAIFLRYSLTTRLDIDARLFLKIVKYNTVGEGLFILWLLTL